MKKYFGSLAALCLLFAGFGVTGTSTATAQDQANATTPPPKVLVILREFLKPGKSGSLHQKSASAFAQAFAQAQWPEHYLAMDSISGKPRTLYFLAYDSFADWGKDNESMMKNATLGQALDSADQAESGTVRSEDSGAFVYQPDKSVSASVDIPHMRYMEITMITVRPGHDADWDQVVKLHDSIFGHGPNAHWAMYSKYFGADSSGVYIALHAMRSLAEVDENRAADKQAFAAASAEQKKQWADLGASTIKSVETNLFVFNPKISYPPAAWKTADPGFWGQQQ